jgi:hypothetical protein
MSLSSERRRGLFFVGNMLGKLIEGLMKGQVIVGNMTGEMIVMNMTGKIMGAQAGIDGNTRADTIAVKGQTYRCIECRSTNDPESSCTGAHQREVLLPYQ